jgi:hypothetical protein
VHWIFEQALKFVGEEPRKEARTERKRGHASSSEGDVEFGAGLQGSECIVVDGLADGISKELGVRKDRLFAKESTWVEVLCVGACPPLEVVDGGLTESR